MDIEKVSDNLFERAVDLIETAKLNIVKTVNNNMVYTYFGIGQMIIEKEQNGEIRAEYGKQVIKNLSERLQNKYKSGYSQRNVEQMRQFYLTFSIPQTASAELKNNKNIMNTKDLRLTWSHYLLLIVARQKRFSFDERHFYIDLVFYNRLLRCFVLIDLKIGDLKHQDIGQMQMYINYYDRYVKLDDENKTVGIILCRDKSETLVEITLPVDNDQIFASRYQTVLPSKDEFKRLINNKI